MHKIWPGRRAHYVECENINNSDLDGVSLTHLLPFAKVGQYKVNLFIVLCNINQTLLK